VLQLGIAGSLHHSSNAFSSLLQTSFEIALSHKVLNVVKLGILGQNNASIFVLDRNICESHSFIV
jgi:hypothetical protein